MPLQLNRQQEQLVRRIISEGIKRGWTPEEIASILSIALIESNLNPQTIGDRGTSFGLFQVNQSRFPKYGVTLSTAKKLLDPNYQIPLVFNDFEQLRSILKRRMPEMYQPLPKEASPEEVIERFSRAFVIYSTYWNRPAYVDDILSGNMEIYKQVYPKVSGDTLRQRFRQGIELLQRYYPVIAKELSVGQLYQQLRKTLFPEPKPVGPELRRVIPQTPPMAIITPIVMNLPNTLKAFRQFEMLEEQLKPKEKVQYRLLPGWDAKTFEERVIGHILASEPSFALIWQGLPPLSKTTLKSILSNVAKKLESETDPQKQRQIIADALFSISRLEGIKAPEPSLPAKVGQVIKHFVVEGGKDLWALILSVTAPAAYFQKVPFQHRDKSGKVIRTEEIPVYEAIRRTLPQTIEQIIPRHMDAEKAAVSELLRFILPEKRSEAALAPLQVIGEGLWNALLQLGGGVIEFGASILDYVVGFFKEPRSAALIRKWIDRISTKYTATAVKLAENPDFRKRHYQHALVFLLSVAPKEVGRNLQPTGTGWRMYAMHYLASTIADIVSQNPVLNYVLPPSVRENILSRFPVAGVLAGTWVGAGLARATVSAIGKLGEAMGLSQRAVNWLQKASNVALNIAVGDPVEIARPWMVTGMTKKIVDAAFKVDEDVSLATKVARLITNPKSELLEYLSKPQLITETKGAELAGDILEAYRRAYWFSNIITSAMQGAVTGLIYMSPQYGDSRDYIAGMLSGLILHGGPGAIRFLLGRTNKAIYNMIRRKGRFTEAFTEPLWSQVSIPPEIALALWAHLREYIGEVSKYVPRLASLTRQEILVQLLSELKSDKIFKLLEEQRKIEAEMSVPVRRLRLPPERITEIIRRRYGEEPPPSAPTPKPPEPQPPKPQLPKPKRPIKGPVTREEMMRIITETEQVPPKEHLWVSAAPIHPMPKPRQPIIGPVTREEMMRIRWDVPKVPPKEHLGVVLYQLADEVGGSREVADNIRNMIFRARLANWIHYDDVIDAATAIASANEIKEKILMLLDLFHDFRFINSEHYNTTKNGVENIYDSFMNRVRTAEPSQIPYEYARFLFTIGDYAIRDLTEPFALMALSPVTDIRHPAFIQTAKEILELFDKVRQTVKEILEPATIRGIEGESAVRDAQVPFVDITKGGIRAEVANALLAINSDKINLTRSINRLRNLVANPNLNQLPISFIIFVSDKPHEVETAYDVLRTGGYDVTVGRFRRTHTYTVVGAKGTKWGELPAETRQSFLNDFMRIAMQSSDVSFDTIISVNDFLNDFNEDAMFRELDKAVFRLFLGMQYPEEFPTFMDVVKSRRIRQLTDRLYDILLEKFTSGETQFPSQFVNLIQEPTTKDYWRRSTQRYLNALINRKKDMLIYTRPFPEYLIRDDIPTWVAFYVIYKTYKHPSIGVLMYDIGRSYSKIIGGVGKLIELLRRGHDEAVSRMLTELFALSSEEGIGRGILTVLPNLTEPLAISRLDEHTFYIAVPPYTIEEFLLDYLIPYYAVISETTRKVEQTPLNLFTQFILERYGNTLKDEEIEILKKLRERSPGGTIYHFGSQLSEVFPIVLPPPSSLGIEDVVKSVLDDIATKYGENSLVFLFAKNISETPIGFVLGSVKDIFGTPIAFYSERLPNIIVINKPTATVSAIVHENIHKLHSYLASPTRRFDTFKMLYDIVSANSMWFKRQFSEEGIARKVLSTLVGNDADRARQHAFMYGDFLVDYRNFATLSGFPTSYFNPDDTGENIAKAFILYPIVAAYEGFKDLKDKNLTPFTAWFWGLMSRWIEHDEEFARRLNTSIFLLNEAVRSLSEQIGSAENFISRLPENVRNRFLGIIQSIAEQIQSPYVVSLTNLDQPLSENFLNATEHSFVYMHSVWPIQRDIIRNLDDLYEWLRRFLQVTPEEKGLILRFVEELRLNMSKLISSFDDIISAITELGGNFIRNSPYGDELLRTGRVKIDIGEYNINLLFTETPTSIGDAILKGGKWRDVAHYMTYHFLPFLREIIHMTSRNIRDVNMQAFAENFAKTYDQLQSMFATLLEDKEVLRGILKIASPVIGILPSIRENRVFEELGLTPLSLGEQNIAFIETIYKPILERYGIVFSLENTSEPQKFINMVLSPSLKSEVNPLTNHILNDPLLRTASFRTAWVLHELLGYAQESSPATLVETWERVVFPIITISTEAAFNGMAVAAYHLFGKSVQDAFSAMASIFNIREELFRAEDIPTRGIGEVLNDAMEITDRIIFDTAKDVLAQRLVQIGIPEEVVSAKLDTLLKALRHDVEMLVIGQLPIHPIYSLNQIADMYRGNPFIRVIGSSVHPVKYKEVFRRNLGEMIDVVGLPYKDIHAFPVARITLNFLMNEAAKRIPEIREWLNQLANSIDNPQQFITIAEGFPKGALQQFVQVERQNIQLGSWIARMFVENLSRVVLMDERFREIVSSIEEGYRRLKDRSEEGLKAINRMREAIAQFIVDTIKHIGIQLYPYTAQAHLLSQLPVAKKQYTATLRVLDVQKYAPFLAPILSSSPGILLSTKDALVQLGLTNTSVQDILHRASYGIFMRHVANKINQFWGEFEQALRTSGLDDEKIVAIKSAFVESDIPTIKDELANAWKFRGEQGLIEYEYRPEEFPELALRWSPNEIEQLKSDLLGLLTNITSEVSTIKHHAEVNALTDTRMQLLQRLGSLQVISHMDESGNIVEILTDRSMNKVDLEDIVNSMLDLFGGIIDEHADEIEKILQRSFAHGEKSPTAIGEAAYEARKLVEALVNWDVEYVAKTLRIAPEVGKDLAKILSSYIIEDVTETYYPYYAVKYIPQDEGYRLFQSFLNRGRRAATMPQLLGLLGAIAAGYALYNISPDIQALFHRAWELLSSVPLFNPLLITAGIGTAASLLYRWITGKPILPIISDITSRAARTLAAKLPQKETTKDAVKRAIYDHLSQLGMEHRANIVSVLIDELFEDMAKIDIADFMWDEIATQLQPSQAPQPVIGMTGFNRRLSSSERNEFAQKLAQKVALTSILLSNSTWFDTLHEAAKVTVDGYIFTEGLKALLTSTQRPEYVDRAMAQLMLVKGLMRKVKDDWKQLRGSKVSDVIKQRISTKVVTPSGTTRHVLTANDLSVEIGHGTGNPQTVKFGDLTIEQAWDELMRQYGFTDVVFSRMVNAKPQERMHLLKTAIGAIRSKFKNAVINSAPSQLREMSAIAGEVLTEIRGIMSAFRNPEIISALGTHPQLQAFFTAKLMSVVDLLNHPRVTSYVSQIPILNDIRDVTVAYLNEIKQQLPDVYQTAEEIYRQGEKFVKQVAQSLIGATTANGIIRSLKQLTDGVQSLWRYIAHTASRRLQVAGLPRIEATILRTDIAEAEQAVNKAWSAEVKRPFNRQLLHEVLAESIADFIKTSPYSRFYISLVTSKQMPKEKPLGMWLLFARQAEEMAKQIAIETKVPKEEIFGAINTAFYYAYRAKPLGIRSFDEVFDMIENPSAKKALTDPKWRTRVESLISQLAILGNYLTSRLGMKGWTAEWLFKGEPITNIVERSYFPQAEQLREVPREIFLSTFAALYDTLATGVNDRILVTRWGMGRRFFQMQRTGRASPKHQQAILILTNAIRSLVSYDALVPYSNYLKALMVLAPSWLTPAISRELHLAIGSPLIGRSIDNAWTLLAETLVSKAESHQLLLQASRTAAPLVFEETMQRIYGPGARVLSTIQTSQLAWNISSVLRQFTSLPYISARIVADFEEPGFAILPLLYLPRAIKIIVNGFDKTPLGTLERMIVEKLPALKARRAQTERAVLLKGIELLNSIMQSPRGRASMEKLLDPAASDVEKHRAFIDLWRHTERSMTIPQIMTELGLAMLSFFDEAMVLSGALAGADAYLQYAIAKGVPITEEVIRRAINYGAGLAEDTQASPAISSSPMFLQNPRVAQFIAPALRQFVLIGSSIAETNSYLYTTSARKAFEIFTAKSNKDRIDAISTFIATITAFALMNIMLMGINSLYEAATGRQLEEVPVGYPPDEESKRITNILSDLIVSATPRYFHRLMNIATAAFIGNLPIAREQVISTDTPPLLRVGGGALIAGMKGVEILNAYREVGLLPQYKDAEFWKRFYAAVDFAAKQGTDVSRISSLGDLLMAACIIGSLHPKVAEIAGALPMGQLTRTARAIAATKEGIPPAAAAFTPDIAAYGIQYVAGVPMLFGTYSPIAILSILRGPVSEAISLQRSAIEKAHYLASHIKNQSPYGAFIGLSEFVRRSWGAPNIKAARYLTHPNFWLRGEMAKTGLGQALSEFIESANKGEGFVYDYIRNRPMDFIVLMLTFSPRNIAILAKDAGKRWMVEGVFSPDLFMSDLTQMLGYNPQLISHLYSAAKIASKANLFDATIMRDINYRKFMRVRQVIGKARAAHTMRGEK